MLYVILLLLSCSIPHDTFSMLSNAGAGGLPAAAAATATYKSFGSQCSQRTKAKNEPTCTIEIQNHPLPTNVIRALENNSVNAVKSYFSHVSDYIANRKQLNQALMHIAKTSPNPDQEMLSFILDVIYPGHIEDVECLVAQAAHNGHTRIINFVAKYFPLERITLPIVNAITQNDVNALETLLAGVDANYRPTYGVCRPFVFQAVEHGHVECVRALVTRKAFVLEYKSKLGSSSTPMMLAFDLYKEDEAKNSDLQACRLAVIQELFKGVPKEKVEEVLSWHLDFMPTSLHSKISMAVNQVLSPDRIVMDTQEELRDYKERDKAALACLGVCLNGCFLAGSQAYCLWAGLCKKRN